MKGETFNFYLHHQVCPRQEQHSCGKRSAVPSDGDLSATAQQWNATINTRKQAIWGCPQIRLVLQSFLQAAAPHGHAALDIMLFSFHLKSAFRSPWLSSGLSVWVVLFSFETSEKGKCCLMGNNCLQEELSLCCSLYSSLMGWGAFQGSFVVACSLQLKRLTSLADNTSCD